VKKIPSKSRNSPFDGRSFKGAVVATIVAGRVALSDSVILEGFLFRGILEIHSPAAPPAKCLSGGPQFGMPSQLRRSAKRW